MSQHSPANIFARIETLRKWQDEQQERLLKQESDQTAFLSGEKKRLNDALSAGDSSNAETPQQTSVKGSLKAEPVILDEQPIVSPKKDFNEMLEENLKYYGDEQSAKQNIKPKRQFLKKGAGLGRFRLAPNVDSKNVSTPKSKSVLQKKMDIKKQPASLKKPSDANLTNRASWAMVLEQVPPPTTPLLTPDQSIEQRAFEKQLEKELLMKQDMDELRIFEILEQKAANSSFCSTSSTITKLIGRSVPPSKLTRPHVRFVEYDSGNDSQKSLWRFKDDSVWTSENEDEENDSDASSSTISTCSNQSIVGKTFREAGTNTDPVVVPPINSELLKTRLEQLEKEIETFRAENARTNKLRNELDKENSKSKKEIIEQQEKIEEERKKLAKDKMLLDKYTKEIKSKPMKKEREEINLLQTKIAALTEEIKLKDSKHGASQARYRNQLRALEKENATLKADNESLRKLNGQLQAKTQKLESRKPSDTKVLHEINKNLTKLTLGAKNKCKLTVKNKRNSKENVENKENDESSDDSLCGATIDKISSLDPSFEFVERDYERMFGTLHQTSLHPQQSEGDPEDSYRRDRDEIYLPDGTKQITYSNGNVKIISPDNATITMKYFNGDIKETRMETGTIRYFYSSANTWHTTFAEDGLEVLEFSNGQIEKRHKDGSTEITFPDGCVRCTTPNGTEQLQYLDGTLVVTDRDGDTVLTFPNGQKEIHTHEHKRRIYPDGTVKILYPDGIQETRYANGRVRLKDNDGNLIMDSG